MVEERETAYPLVFGFLAVAIVLFIVATVVRRPSPRVTVNLTHPAPASARGVGN